MTVQVCLYAFMVFKLNDYRVSLLYIKKMLLASKCFGNTDFEHLCDANFTLYQVYSGTDEPLFEGIQSNCCVKN